MEVCVLASGSSGNCIYVAAAGTRLLIDFGLSARDVTARLREIGRSLDEIDAVLCTHDHADHCKGLTVAARRHPFRLLANGGTAEAVERADRSGGSPPHWEMFENGQAVTVGDIAVESFSVPHDAADTVGFVLSHGRTRLGLCTDLGFATALVRRRLSGCDALILEFNHDVEMVRQSDRPPSLKRRVLGRFGHLSNDDAAALLGEVASARLQVVFPAHLSEDCNREHLAEQAARAALDRAGCGATRLVMTARHRPTGLVALA